MAIAFESLYSDIGGRCGKLTIGKKTVRTPALLPVINPHLQLVTPHEIQEMGVEAIITNAYIISQSRQFRERALTEGLHKVLGFDGVIITDSGSFQLSVYGQVSITSTGTLAFQRDIGSDIWVPLDIPTSPPPTGRQRNRNWQLPCGGWPRHGRSSAGMPRSPDRYRAVSLKTFGNRRGGMCPGMGFWFCPIGAVVPLMESYRYRDLVSVVMAAKRTLSPVCLHHLLAPATRRCSRLPPRWVATCSIRRPMPFTRKPGGT